MVEGEVGSMTSEVTPTPTLGRPESISVQVAPQPRPAITPRIAAERTPARRTEFLKLPIRASTSRHVHHSENDARCSRIQSMPGAGGYGQDSHVEVRQPGGKP